MASSMSNVAAVFLIPHTIFILRLAYPFQGFHRSSLAIPRITKCLVYTMADGGNIKARFRDQNRERSSPSGYQQNRFSLAIVRFSITVPYFSYQAQGNDLPLGRTPCLALVHWLNICNNSLSSTCDLRTHLLSSETCDRMKWNLGHASHLSGARHCVHYA